MPAIRAALAAATVIPATANPWLMRTWTVTLRVHWGGRSHGRRAPACGEHGVRVCGHQPNGRVSYALFSGHPLPDMARWGQRTRPPFERAGPAAPVQGGLRRWGRVQAGLLRAVGANAR